MFENKTKKYVMLIRVFCCLGVLCFFAGFFVAASSVDNVFTGIAVIVTGAIMALATLVPTVKLIQLQKDQKENRIKQLEEDVELLKSKIL